MKKNEENVQIDFVTFEDGMVESMSIPKEDTEQCTRNPLWEHPLPSEFKIRDITGRVVHQGKVNKDGSLEWN